MLICSKDYCTLIILGSDVEPDYGKHLIKFQFHFEQNIKSKNIIQVEIYDKDNEILETRKFKFKSIRDNILLTTNLLLNEDSKYYFKFIPIYH